MEVPRCEAEAASARAGMPEFGDWACKGSRQWSVETSARWGDPIVSMNGDVMWYRIWGLIENGYACLVGLLCVVMRCPCHALEWCESSLRFECHVESIDYYEYCAPRNANDV